MTDRPRGVVTGASGGIGEAIARRLAGAGWELLLVARREQRLSELAGELPGARFLCCDLTQDDAAVRIGGRVDEGWDGRLQLLVNNAGAGYQANFGTPDGGWSNIERTMRLNFEAAVRVTEQLLPALRAGAPSAIFNMGSVSGRLATPGRGAYSASKFALLGWSKSLRAEERQAGVRVSTMLPGFVATERTPHQELLARRLTRWVVSSPDVVANALVRALADPPATVTVPRRWTALLLLEAVTPGLVDRLNTRAARAA